MKKEQITIEMIRRDLHMIRKYGLYKNELIKYTEENRCLMRRQFYDTLIMYAPADMQLVYYKMYTTGMTEEALADEMGYSTVYISQLKARLLNFFHSILNVEDFVV